MCGIAGILHLDGRPASAERLRAMTDILAHRGPDGDGFFVAGPVGLGHRRLAIIDLATGDQPMVSEDGARALVFNGEIYNFREIRRQLESHGHRFRTQSDTEVLLRSYEEWGTDCLRRLRGMFAFALWDGRARRMLLARDRVGIKPLVYAWDGRRLLFGSEIKALLQDPELRREMDWDGLGEYLCFHHVPGPRTIFRGVRKLPPASYLLLDLDRGTPRIEAYWDLRLAPDERRREEDWIGELDARLADAVASHLVSDVPVGAFLSGGLDSSTVVALMARAGASPVRTFSIGFSEADFDELHYARLLSRRYGTEHYEFVVKPEALDVLPRLTWQFDEPFADASALPSYYVSKMTREHVTVALSGDGGDENFAGYARYASAERLHRRLDRRPAGRLLRALLRTAGRRLPPGFRGQRWTELRGADPVHRYFLMMTGHRAGRLPHLLEPAAAAQISNAPGAEDFRRRAREAATADYVATLQYLDVRTYLPDDILTKVDRTSMLVSLEARVPLLDHTLMEFVATMPTTLKLRGGIGKYLLRQAMADKLPAELLDRRKMGFGVPLERWFRGDLASHARDVLLSRGARERGWIAPAPVGRLLDEHHAGRRDHSAQIWALLCLELWARHWLDASAPELASIDGAVIARSGATGAPASSP